MIKKTNLIILVIFITMINFNVIGKLNNEAEYYISQILKTKIPYETNLQNVRFIVKSNHVYPPVGKSSTIFADYLIKNDLIKGKVIVEIRSGCMPIGIFAAKNGAKRVVGLDSNVDALRCAQENVIGNSLAGRSSVLTGDNITKDLNEYNGKIDVLFTNLPWDEISQRDYNKIPKDRKALSNSFYDVNNQFITSVLTEGYNLLSKNGKLYITATDRVLPRIDKVCQKTNRNYKVVAQEAHKNGNMHYILEFSAAK